MDMEASKIQAIVKVGRQIISMISLEIAVNGPKKCSATNTMLAGKNGGGVYYNPGSYGADFYFCDCPSYTLSSTGSRPTLYLIP